MRDLNFFSSVKEKKEETNKVRLIIISVIILLIGVILLNTGFQVIKLMGMKKDMAELELELNDPDYLLRVDEARTKISIFEEMQEEQTFFTDLQGSMSKIHRVNEAIMKFLSKEMIRNLFLMKLDIEDNAITLVGRALNKRVIAQFEYDLRHTGKFHAIRITEIKRPEEDDKYYDFTMMIETKDVILDEA